MIPLAQSEPYRFVDRALFGIRLATILALLLLTFMQPIVHPLGFPTWALLLLFASYSLLFDLLGNRLRWLRSFARRAILDLLMVALIYFLGSEPGGPLFILFFLAVDYAAARMTVRGTLLYTIAVAAVVALIDLVNFMWLPAASDLRMVGARGVMLSLVGVGMAIVMRRLVLEQQRTQSARNETARLEEIDQFRTDFIWTLSHDLRTPLTAVRAGLGMLETSALERLRPDEQGLMDNARRNTERLGLLIDDLLALNQLEAGTLQLERELLDLRAVVMAAKAAVKPLLDEKQQQLEIDLPEALWVVGDQQRLEQVAVNMLANAHYHTPMSARISVSASFIADSVRISVRDTGPGIPSEELESIFQRFYRLNSVKGGSGLGLAIGRSIVELHGGRIWAESQLGKGAVFHVALPRCQEGANDDTEVADR